MPSWGYPAGYEGPSGSGPSAALNKLSYWSGKSSFHRARRLFCGHGMASWEQKGVLAQLLRAGIRVILLSSPHSCTNPSSGN